MLAAVGVEAWQWLVMTCDGSPCFIQVANSWVDCAQGEEIERFRCSTFTRIQHRYVGSSFASQMPHFGLPMKTPDQPCFNSCTQAFSLDGRFSVLGFRWFPCFFFNGPGEKLVIPASARKSVVGFVGTMKSKTIGFLDLLPGVL